MTPEAILLHHLDDIDAKMNFMGRLREKMDQPGPQWTEYQRPLERFLYLRGTPQKGEMEEGVPEEPIVPKLPAASATVPPEPAGQETTTQKKNAENDKKQPSLF